MGQGVEGRVAGASGTLVTIETARAGVEDGMVAPKGEAEVEGTTLWEIIES